MSQWWERSSPTNVSRVRLPDPASYVGWVCCWFSSLLREVFLRVLRFFLSPQKPTHPNSKTILECVFISKRVLVNFLGLRWWKKLHIYIFHLHVCEWLNKWDYWPDSLAVCALENTDADPDKAIPKFVFFLHFLSLLKCRRKLIKRRGKTINNKRKLCE